MIPVNVQSLRDPAASYSVADNVPPRFAALPAEAPSRYSIAVPELPGAMVGFSFAAIEALRAHFGAAWLHLVFTGLDATDPAVVRFCLELSLKGAPLDPFLNLVALDRTAELIATALLLRIRG